MFVMIMNIIQGCDFDYKGFVIGEVILGVNFFKDIFVGICDIVGGWLVVYEEEFVKVWQIVIDEMCQCVQVFGGNVVIGVDFDYEMVG